MKDVRDGGTLDESRVPVNTQRRRLGRWLRALAGTCLAVTMAGDPRWWQAASPRRCLPASSPPRRATNARVDRQCGDIRNRPGAPTLLIPRVGSNQVTLLWTKPASDGGSSIIGYTVYQGTSPGGESGTAVSKSLVTSPFTVMGPTTGPRITSRWPRSTGSVRVSRRMRCRRPRRRPRRGSPPD